MDTPGYSAVHISRVALRKVQERCVCLFFKVSKRHRLAREELMRVRIPLSRFGLYTCCLYLLVACTSLPVPTVSPGGGAASPSVTEVVTANMLEQRPLSIPTIPAGVVCPTTPVERVSPDFGLAQGKGPVYATTGASKISPHAILYYADAEHFGTDIQANNGWGGQKVLWFIHPGYTGFILIRGRQLDGIHQVRFNQLQ